MKIEDLKNVIKEVVNEQLAPLQATQRNYADAIQGAQSEQAKAAAETPAPTGEVVEPGIRLARAAKLMIIAKNDPEKAYWYAAGSPTTGQKGMYPQDTELHAAFKALSATTPTEGGFLIPEQYSNEIIPLLRAKAVVRTMGARSLPLAGGNLNIPKMLGGAQSYYLGENMDAKKSQPSFGNLRLSGKKLVTMVPVSNDLLRLTSDAADRMIRDDMVKSIALKEDFVAMYGAGTEFTPRGISKAAGIGKKDISALPTSDTMGDFLGTLMTKNIDWTSVGWIFNGFVWNILYQLKTTTGAYLHRAEMDRGMFLGFPFKISNQIQNGADAHGLTDIFFGDFSEFIIGEEMAMEMLASQEAAYMDNGQLVSAFSQDQTVIKMTSKHDFGIRHPEAFILGQNVWTK